MLHQQMQTAAEQVLAAMACRAMLVTANEGDPECVALLIAVKLDGSIEIEWVAADGQAIGGGSL